MSILGTVLTALICGSNSGDVVNTFGSASGSRNVILRTSAHGLGTFGDNHSRDSKDYNLWGERPPISDPRVDVDITCEPLMGSADSVHRLRPFFRHRRRANILQRLSDVALTASGSHHT